MYTLFFKRFSIPLAQYCSPGFYITYVNPVHPDEIWNSARNPLTTQLTAIRGDVDFFLRLNSLLGFQTLLRFQTLSPEQHLLHLKNVTNLEFLLTANAASYSFKFSGIGHSLPRSDLVCLALGN